MKMLNKFYTTIVLFFVLLSASFAQNKLEYKLHKDDAFTVTQKANQDIVQNINGSKHEMNNLLSGVFTFRVTNITDSTYIMDFKFDAFKMATTSNIYGTLLNVDTDKEVLDDDIEGKMFAELTSTTLKMEMLKNGKIISVTGTEALVDNMINATGVEDEFTKELMKEAMKKEFGNESLSESFGQMTYIYPSKTTKVNDQWQTQFEGDLKADNTWTLQALDKDKITIKGDSTIKMLMEEDSHTMSLNGTQNTSLSAFKESGFIHTMTVTSNAEGNTEMKNLSAVKIPTTITSTTTYNVVKNVQ